MPDESKGILGHLPPLPRAALNNSVIGMEQAYRKRKGLPLLTDADIEALKAGEPMPWERGDGEPSSAPAAASEAASSPAPAAVAAAPPPAATAAIREDVAKWVAEGKKWSKSTIAAEQARRGRKGLPALNDEEIAALLGEPVEASAAPAAPPLQTAAAVPAPAAPSGPISEEVAKWVAEGKKWSKSTIAAEQARRKRKNLATLTDAEVTALLGEPAEQTTVPAAAPAAARPAAAAASPRPAAVASAAASVGRAGAATKYVGTPAVGTSKAAAAGGVAAVGPEDNAVNQGRRRFAWTAIGFPDRMVHCLLPFLSAANFV